MNIEKKKLIMNAFINSQFNYCFQVWIFHNHSFNNKMPRYQEKCQRIVYNDSHLSHEQLLKIYMLSTS